MALLVANKKKVKDIRIALEQLDYYDASRKITKDQATPPHSECTEKFALPITESCYKHFIFLQEKGVTLPAPFENCSLSEPDPPLKSSRLNAKGQLQLTVLKLLGESVCHETMNKMTNGIPTSWECHGDLVVLPKTSFSDDLWKAYFENLSESQLKSFWSEISVTLKCKRLALDGKISDDSFRSPSVTLILGDNGWVDHVDNGIHYMFDVTKCMFSSGNITEKLRLANFDCSGETIVDLYAGIGYFVLPYLVHAGAELVHACEWNPHAVEALKRGLKANGVEDRCIVHYGDCKKAVLGNIADRVNVGLIPSSEEGWPAACTALKPSTGGWLHIHGNVNRNIDDNSASGIQEGTKAFERFSHLLSSRYLKCVPVAKWISYVVEQVSMLLTKSRKTSESWSVQVRHVEHVKSYAPHVSHLVLDLECRPQVVQCMNNDS